MPVAVRPVVEQRFGVVLGAGDAGGGVGVPGGGDAEFSDEGGAGVDQVAGCCLGGSAARRASLASVGQRRTGRVVWVGCVCLHHGGCGSRLLS